MAKTTITEQRKDTLYRDGHHPPQIDDDLETEDPIHSNEYFSDEYDIKKHFTSIHGNIRKVISAAFVLAKFGDKDKEYAIQMFQNAKYATYIMKRAYRIALKKRRMSDTEKKEVYNQIQGAIKRVYMFFMQHLEMLATVNINVDSNYLASHTMGTLEEEKEPTEIESLAEVMKENMKPKPKREE